MAGYCLVAFAAPEFEVRWDLLEAVPYLLLSQST